jgi:hypothetical protein
MIVAHERNTDENGDPNHAWPDAGNQRARTPSRLGRAVLAAPVRAAMAAAAQPFIPVAEMQQRASATIVAATGAEAG